jgi:hypothetical protein
MGGRTRSSGTPSTVSHVVFTIVARRLCRLFARRPSSLSRAQLATPLWDSFVRNDQLHVSRVFLAFSIISADLVTKSDGDLLGLSIGNELRL